MERQVDEFRFKINKRLTEIAQQIQESEKNIYSRQRLLEEHYARLEKTLAREIEQARNLVNELYKAKESLSSENLHVLEKLCNIINELRNY